MMKGVKDQPGVAAKILGPIGDANIEVDMIVQNVGSDGLADRYHRGLSPDDILVFVGGGDAGAHSSFLPSWSRGRNSLMQYEIV